MLAVEVKFSIDWQPGTRFLSNSSIGSLDEVAKTLIEDKTLVFWIKVGEEPRFANEFEPSTQKNHGTNFQKERARSVYTYLREQDVPSNQISYSELKYDFNTDFNTRTQNHLLDKNDGSIVEAGFKHK